MCFPILLANPFAYSCNCTVHTSHKNGMLEQRGNAVKCPKTNYYKSSLVIDFAQTCRVASIDNGMYTVCSYDTPQ